MVADVPNPTYWKSWRYDKLCAIGGRVPVRIDIPKMSRSNGRPELEVIANVRAALLLQGSIISIPCSLVYRWPLIFKGETRGSFPSRGFSRKATSKTPKGRVTQLCEERRC